eukprot:1140804-Pelagomonas_calceolata.AAC.1
MSYETQVCYTRSAQEWIFKSEFHMKRKSVIQGLHKSGCSRVNLVTSNEQPCPPLNLRHQNQNLGA